MNGQDFEKLLDNEKEWRRAMWKRLDKLEHNTNNLRIQNAAFAGIIGFFTSVLHNWFRTKL